MIETETETVKYRCYGTTKVTPALTDTRPLSRPRTSTLTLTDLIACCLLIPMVRGKEVDSSVSGKIGFFGENQPDSGQKATSGFWTAHRPCLV